ncbi:MAG: FtsX-like permease family protein [Zoogloeaceae bacterium]|jgi:putative ABC transport system permease protein|nr:FtsX-like permease family protein [Zoogloeaceae bacterium]
MKLYQIALREIGRRKMRTLYTASSVAISVALLIAALMVGMAGQKDLLLTIARYGHSLTIFPATSNETSLQNFGIGTGHYIPEDSIPTIQEVYEKAIRIGWEKKGGFVLDAGAPGGVDMLQPAVFTPRLYEETTVQGKKVVIAGIRPSEEYTARFWWEVDEGSLLQKNDECMVGKVFSKVTGVKAGDVLTINEKPFRVSGVLRETDSPDDYMIFAHLGKVQEAFGKPNRVSLINVRAMCNYCPVGEAELALNTTVVGIRATSQREIAEAQHRIFKNVTSVIVGLVLLSMIIACMAVFNMVMGNIHNRLREAGLLKVAGASRGQLMRLFIYESLIIGLVGGLIGYGLGHALAVTVGPMLLSGAVIEPQWEYLPIAVGAAMIASMLATIYPAYYISRIRASEAFRAL